MLFFARTRRVRLALLGFSLLSALCAFQRPFREYPGREYNNFPIPPDYNNPAEWAFARLMYPSGRYSDIPGADFTQGYTTWTMDYPRSDRHLSQAVRRLTRIDARSVEQPVNLDDGNEVFYWPWLYAVEVGHWELTDAQTQKLREYLLRGGFFMCDDFHGTLERQAFIGSMGRVFPDRPIVEIENADAIFHTVFDLNERFRCPALNISKPDASTSMMALRLIGAAFTTTRDVSWWQSAITWTWAIPGSTPTIRNIRRSFQRSESAWV